MKATLSSFAKTLQFNATSNFIRTVDYHFILMHQKSPSIKTRTLQNVHIRVDNNGCALTPIQRTLANYTPAQQLRAHNNRYICMTMFDIFCEIRYRTRRCDFVVRTNSWVLGNGSIRCLNFCFFFVLVLMLTS